MSRKQRFLIAVLDDYQRVALRMADWSVLDAHAEVAAFNDHLNDPESVVARLQPYHIICVMRERTPLTRAILKRLPNLRLIASTGARNASIDAEAAQELGISVTNTGYFAAPTIEFTWAMILGVSRHLVDEANSVRTGGWQVQVGEDLGGKTLALLGLGNIGSAVARIGRAFGMRIIAWSQNLTPERAAEHEAEYVSKEQLFRQADILSIHLILSKRTRDLVSADDLALMKPTARLVNTSRGPIVVEADLLHALRNGTIAGAAVDVWEEEPLPGDHPLRTQPNMLATPHLGYVSRGLYERFYGDAVANIKKWIVEQPA